MFVNSQSVGPWQAFKPSLMLASKARLKRLSVAPLYGNLLALPENTILEFTKHYNTQVFVLGKLFQPNLMFSTKTGAYHSETPFN